MSPRRDPGEVSGDSPARSLSSLQRDCVWQVFSILFLGKLFFTLIKQKRCFLCCDKAKLRFYLKLDTCQPVRLEAGRFDVSGGFLSLSF
jgi:hypothetical protein